MYLDPRGYPHDTRSNDTEFGYDQNIWFRNVEVIVANDVGREPVQYVRNIFKYYTAYKLVSEQDEIRQQLKTETQAED